MSSKRSLAAWGAVAALALIAVLILRPNAVAAQADGDAGVNFVAFACPNLEADLYTECDILTGATFEILADGVPLADSPFTTGPTGLLTGFYFYVSPDATLTVTELSVDPPGNAPAPGFDPLIVNVADITAGGCGGESTCPTIEFINLPFAVADGPAGQPPTAAEVSVLPATGAGGVAVGGDRESLAVLSLLAALVCVALAVAGRTEAVTFGLAPRSHRASRG